ncbi:hypothetical protein H632_c2903p0, partial [Helicosporidium sp. ATCC 50920]
LAPESPAGSPEHAPEGSPLQSPSSPSNAVITWTGIAITGSNAYGLLGIGNATTPSAFQPTLIFEGDAIPVLGGDFACMYSLSFVHCWGNNAVGQLGQPLSTPMAASPTRVLGVELPSRLTAGEQHACLVDDATPKCWGLNAAGQLGNGGTSNSHVPVPISTAYIYEVMSAGLDHTCGIALDAADGNILQCWGGNAFGQLGMGDTENRATPQSLSIRGWYEISAGCSTTCGINGIGIYCWGANDMGQAGSGNTNQFPVPWPMDGTADWFSISTWGKTTCALNEGAQMFCWGDGSQGQMGNHVSTVVNLDPQNVWNPNPDNFISISVGGNTVCAASDSFRILCWGDDSVGQAGVPPASGPQNYPLGLPGDFVAVPYARNSATIFHTMNFETPDYTPPGQ